MNAYIVRIITLIIVGTFITSPVGNTQNASAAENTENIVVVSENPNVSVAMTTVTSVDRSTKFNSDPWERLIPGQIFNVAGLPDLSIWFSQDCNAFLVNWDGTYIIGVKAGNAWDVQLSNQHLVWDPSMDLKLSGTFDFQALQDTQILQGDMFLRFIDGRLAATWNFVPLGNSK